MKKNLYFIALIACLCLFFAKADIIHGTTYAEGLPFTISSAGILTFDTSVQCSSGHTYCYFLWVFGIYPNEISSRATIKYGEVVSMDAEDLTGQWEGDGDYYLKMHYDAENDYLYSLPFIRESAIWGIPSPAVEITSPANNSTITDLSTMLDISYSYLATATYPYLYVFFNDSLIGEQSYAWRTDLTTSAGTISAPFTTFNFTKNGWWYVSVFQYSYTQSPPALYFYNPASGSSTYYQLNLDLSTLPTPYTFTTWTDWYSANATGTPSVWITGMVGFLQPIFEKVGEFGNRIKTYLDISDAYTKGNALGSVIPVVSAYVNKINLFFSGFPIVQFFQWTIIVMVGIFAVKIILKLLSFIPFFGGGG